MFIVKQTNFFLLNKALIEYLKSLETSFIYIHYQYYIGMIVNYIKIRDFEYLRVIKNILPYELSRTI